MITRSPAALTLTNRTASMSVTPGIARISESTASGKSAARPVAISGAIADEKIGDDRLSVPVTNVLHIVGYRIRQANSRAYRDEHDGYGERGAGPVPDELPAAQS